MSTSTINFLNINSGSIQAISTVILLIVTIWYVYYTKQIVKESINARKDTRLPIIRIEISGPVIGYGKDAEGRDKKHIVIYFENIGYGLARNARLLFAYKDSVQINNLDVGEKTNYSLELEFDEENKLNSLSFDDKKISVFYDDIFGRTISTVAYFEHNHRGSWIEFDIASWHPVIPD